MDHLRNMVSARGYNLGMVPKIMALAVSGVLVLGLCVAVLSRTLLYSGAADAARERVDTNMAVAWDALKARGSSFSIADGKLMAVIMC